MHNIQELINGAVGTFAIVGMDMDGRPFLLAGVAQECGQKRVTLARMHKEQQPRVDGVSVCGVEGASPGTQLHRHMLLGRIENLRFAGNGNHIDCAVGGLLQSWSTRFLPAQFQSKAGGFAERLPQQEAAYFSIALVDCEGVITRTHHSSGIRQTRLFNLTLERGIGHYIAEYRMHAVQRLKIVADPFKVHVPYGGAELLARRICCSAPPGVTIEVATDYVIYRTEEETALVL